MKEFLIYVPKIKGENILSVCGIINYIYINTVLINEKNLDPEEMLT